jgi:DNA-binding MarR family transcriptional regulator
MANKKDSRAEGRGALGGLYGSPEFLIRRAHQIATAVFTETCADLDLTPSQYSALFALREQSPIGQNELGRLISLDRSTTSLVVKILRDRGLVAASTDASDRRKSFLELTNDGRLMLAKAERRNSQSSQELLSVFDKKQASAFLELLDKLANSLEAKSGSGQGK